MTGRKGLEGWSESELERDSGVAERGGAKEKSHSRNVQGGDVIKSASSLSGSNPRTGFGRLTKTKSGRVLRWCMSSGRLCTYAEGQTCPHMTRENVLVEAMWVKLSVM